VLLFEVVFVLIVSVFHFLLDFVSELGFVGREREFIIFLEEDVTLEEKTDSKVSFLSLLGHFRKGEESLDASKSLDLVPVLGLLDDNTMDLGPLLDLSDVLVDEQVLLQQTLFLGELNHFLFCVH